MGMEGVFGEAVDRIGGEPISARMARKAPIRHIDPTLLLATVALAVYGAVMIFSATANKQGAVGLDPTTFLQRQIAYMVAGVVLVVALALFDYRHLGGFAVFVYGATVLGLAVVLTPLGDVQKGDSRWIDFGVFQAQP